MTLRIEFELDGTAVEELETALKERCDDVRQTYDLLSDRGRMEAYGGPTPSYVLESWRQRLATLERMYHTVVGARTGVADPLRQADWSEPLPGLPTQAAVEAHSEARVDEAMARAAVEHESRMDTYPRGLNERLAPGTRVRVTEDGNAGWTGTVVWHAADKVQVEDRRGESYYVHRSQVVVL